MEIFSKLPRAPGSNLDVQSLYRPQGSTTGINALLGQWPGDKTDEEIEAYLKEIS